MPDNPAAAERHERPDGMSELRAAVVGGGLSGLCAALALARGGWLVTIIERATGEPPGGAGLG
ncbi:MAG TPA: NAD(P)-binding protein, partial [Acidimicrobiales bacterium]|nr:NAD(P)-binding protein [Acidimicrobiales bacterium]